jgi:ABC-2 type transport system permease protein
MSTLAAVGEPQQTRSEPPARRSPGLAAAAAAMARHKILVAVRGGEVISALGAPIVFFLGFYTPLYKQYESAGGVYAQFLTPIILLQTGLFAAIMATEAAGLDARAGVRDRVMSLPISRAVPLAGRMSWSLARIALGVAMGLAIGFAFGFRLRGSLWDSALLLALPFVFGIALSVLTDAVGSTAKNSIAIANFLVIPQMVLVMASTGLVPAEGFPSWVQPLVRNQPLSVFTDAMRGLANGSSPSLVAVGAWTVGLMAAAALATVAANWKQANR